MDKTLKEKCESLGKKAGKKIGQDISENTPGKAEEIGQKIGKTVGEQVERVHAAFEKETVSKKEQLGIGGKIGTGLGIVGKRLAEKRYGFLSRLMGTGDLVKDGRQTGAKAEKIVKRTVKNQLSKWTAEKDKNK
jgi:hypothetical protein